MIKYTINAAKLQIVNKRLENFPNLSLKFNLVVAETKVIIKNPIIAI